MKKVIEKKEDDIEKKFKCTCNPNYIFHDCVKCEYCQFKQFQENEALKNAKKIEFNKFSTYFEKYLGDRDIQIYNFINTIKKIESIDLDDMKTKLPSWKVIIITVLAVLTFQTILKAIIYQLRGA